MIILSLTLSLAWADPEPTEIAADVAAEDNTPAPTREDASTDEGPVPEPVWTPAWPGHVSPDSPYYDLETFFAETRHAEGLAAAKARIAKTPNDPELYWLAARFIFEVGELIDRDSGVDKLAMYEEMLALCQTGLDLAPNHPHLLFARGIANGRLGTTRGVLASLFLADDVEDDWLAVANSDFTYASINGSERLPCDSFHSLGIFYRLVPDWWIVKALAGTRGDLDKSLDYLTRANKCSPNRIHVLKQLGVPQMCIGTQRGDDAMLAAGEASIHAFLKLPPASAKDRIDHAHGALLLADPGMACEYSRDGQQELDKEKLDK